MGGDSLQGTKLRHEQLRMNYSRDEMNTFYLDLRKAYDTLDHKLLLIELEAYDIQVIF